MINEKTIISHLYQDKKTGEWVVQTNDEHQMGVAELAAQFAGQFGLPTWGHALGILHDKGKERKAFQQYIRQVNGLPVIEKANYTEHNHAYVGGKLAMSLLGKDILNLLANQIFHIILACMIISMPNTLQKPCNFLKK